MKQNDLKNEQMESDIKEFEREIGGLRDQSKKVESELVRKLQDVSEKYKATVHERDQMQAKLKELTLKAHEMTVTIRDN
jgi:phage host-nuclease inhibitor protein Gam